MLEAVNSVLQTAPFVRANTEQVSTADSFAANPDRVQRAAPQAPYISPYIVLDVNYDKAVIQLRNGDTGDVIDQFPSEASLEARARQATREPLQTQLSDEGAPQVRAETSQDVQVNNAGNSGGAESAPQQAAITAQQQAAFAAAAQVGNTNAGNVTVFA